MKTNTREGGVYCSKWGHLDSIIARAQGYPQIADCTSHWDKNGERGWVLLGSPSVKCEADVPRSAAQQAEDT